MINNRNQFKLSSFYFFFFAALGAFVPYWSTYLKSLGFSPAQIGELLMIVMASKIFAPYLLAWLSDHLKKRLIIIQLSLVAAVITFAGVIPYQSFAWFAFIMAVFGFFWNTTLPLFEALTFNYLGENTHRYSLVRLWGSIGFIVMVITLPYLIEGEKIANLPYFILGLLFLNALTTFLVTDKQNSVQSAKPSPILKTLKKPIVIALLLACALQSLSHGAYYTFFTIYLEEHGYSRNMAGWMWGLGVSAEVLLFIIMHRLLHRYCVCQLFIIALFVTAIRWLMLALWVDNLFILILSQVFHAASFGLFHATAIYLTHELFPGRLQGRGQALYAGMSFGLGGSLGHLLSGYTWGSMGSTWTFLASGIIALVGALIAAKFISQDRLESELG
ncbi:MAG: MFS transporter [Cocleimonas sp.]